jgi:hypothetical protein
MNNRMTTLTIALAAAVVGAGVALILSRAAAQGPTTYAAPRTADGRPDLNGIWQALNEANWDIEAHGTGPSPYPELLGALFAQPAGQGVVQDGPLPYRPEALARRQVNFQNRLTRPTTLELNETTGDPEAKCYMPGVPRATYMPFPFQIVQTPQLVLVAYQFANAVRQIHIDRTPEAPVESWMGWSIGRWEGDTLVVEVTDQVDKTWFDRAGNFHSSAMRVVERYTRISPDHLMYEATIDDPEVFSRPWTMSMPLYRRIEQNAQLIDFKCVEYAQDFMYGHLLSGND